MKKLLLLLGIIILASCSNIDRDAYSTKQIDGVQFDLITIENHQYIWFKPSDGARQAGLAHNENCNNPNHN